MEIAKKRNRASTLESDRQRIDAYISPKLGKLEPNRVTRAHVRQLVQGIGERGRMVTANRVAALVSRLFVYARDELDMPLQNPATGLQSSFKEQSRARVLSDAELKLLWGRLKQPEASPVSLGAAYALQVCTLTLQRAGEIAGMHEDELDLSQDIWVLPATRAKNKHEHVVPLSPEVKRVIEAAIELAHAQRRERLGKSAPKTLQPGFVFPSPRDHERPITRHAITRAMSRICEKTEIKDATPHDLRRTGATAITSERVGLPRFVVSAVLGHISETGGVTRIYDRNGYLPEKRRALNSWALLVDEIVCAPCAKSRGAKDTA